MKSPSGGPRGDVAVTGVGIVSPLGSGRELFWSRLCAGESGIVAAQAPDGKRAAARLADFAPRDLIRSSHFRRMDDASRMIVAAARLAVADAGVATESIPSERLGIVIGSAYGDINDTLDYLHRLFTKGPALVSPMMFPSLVLNAPASYAAMELASTGVDFTVAQGEISAEQAISLGCDIIRSGRADVVLAGAGDQLSKIVWSTCEKLRALSSQRGGAEWCSPYDVERNGLLMGEGAAVLVLESAEYARSRGAAAYAAIENEISFGVRSSLYDWPVDAEGAAGWLRPFLSTIPREDGAQPRHPVDAVFGSANSTRRLDALEVDVVARLFGEASSLVSMTSLKGAVGEFSSAGALTAAAAVLSLRDQVLPPLCNLRRPIGGSLRFAGSTATAMPLQRVLQISFARGGAAAALLYRRMPS
jgi:3-oxoacyl-[acyl-carrier-protein] synthase II